jgi:lincosamide nucleotidyltransferase A/C/D/E
MHAEEMIALYTLLTGHGVRIWVDGGWGIDALLGEQTRPHKDFDALVPCDDLASLIDGLAERDFTLKEIWQENRWIAFPAPLRLIGRAQPGGSEAATAFVLWDKTGRELDVHVLTFDSRGYGIPAWNAEPVYPPDALAGRGMIAGVLVRCLSARMHMRTHTGYALQPKDLQDLRLLHERFGIAYLEEQIRHFPGSEQ